VHFLGERAAFVGAEENVSFVDAEGAIAKVEVLGGGILCAATDGKRIVMGGDNGKLVALDAKGAVTEIALDPKRRWIDNVALHPDGAVAWSVGKTAFVRSGKNEDKFFEVPSTVGGLAFAPKGLRLAIAHYNGVTLWFPNMAANGEFLEWAGSHLGVTFSPDNKFLVTAMHEPALHGWRLADNRHMRMSGYPGRVKSMAWSAGGKFLATERRAGDAPAAFCRLRQQHPRPFRLRRVAADVCQDCCHVLYELLLSAPGQCSGWCDDLNPDVPCNGLRRRLDGRWFHPVNERRRVLQVELTGRAHTFGAQDRPRQLLADPAIGSKRQEIARRVDVNHRHR